MKLGDGGSAIALKKRAIDLDPLRPSNAAGLGYVLYIEGRNDEAITALRSSPAHLGDNSVAGFYLGAALLVQGQPDEALKSVAPLKSNDVSRLTVEASVRGGDRGASDRALVALARQDGVQYQVAEVYAQRREPDLAFAAIDHAWDQGDPGLASFKTDPLLAPLRSDPRFATWLLKIGFP